MHTLLGHFTWFFLLARSSLSCFNKVYSCARQPNYCASELFAAVLTLLQIRVDLRRLWLQMPRKYSALELQLRPSVLVERGNFRVCLIGVMILCGSHMTKMFSMSHNAIARDLRTTSESRSLLSKLSFVNARHNRRIIMLHSAEELLPAVYSAK